MHPLAAIDQSYRNISTVDSLNAVTHFVFSLPPDSNAQIRPAGLSVHTILTATTPLPFPHPDLHHGNSRAGPSQEPRPAPSTVPISDQALGNFASLIYVPLAALPLRSPTSPGRHITRGVRQCLTRGCTLGSPTASFPRQQTLGAASFFLDEGGGRASSSLCRPRPTRRAQARHALCACARIAVFSWSGRR
jgi:hypothetical protein